MELNPQEPRYGYTLAFYQKEQQDLQGAAATLQDLLTQRPGFTDGYLLLAEICVQQGDRPQAEAVLSQALQRENLPPRDRGRIAAALQNLTTSPPSEDNHPGKR